MLCGCSHDDQANVQQELFHDQHLKIAAVTGAPGYVVVGGQRLGYCHDLLAEYARHRNVELDLVSDLSPKAMAHRLRIHTSDAALMLDAHDQSLQTDKMFSVTIGTTCFVMLAREQMLGENLALSQIVDDRKVMISSAFQHTDHYDTLLDSLSRACLYVSSKNSRELAHELQTGQYDFLICEASDAAMSAELLKNLYVVFRFDDAVDIKLLFPQHSELLYEDFCQWWSDYSAGPECDLLRQTYFENKFRSRLKSLGRRSRTINGISVWDDIIKRVGEREGVDWLLLSAIAFEESMFRSDAISRSGATGLMQIMPITARHFNVDQESLADPETNVTIAAKLLRNIEKALEFPDSTALDDKLSIILAAYNCGQKTVSDAIAIAAATGRNPYRWESVADCLKLMGSDEFSTADSLSFRRFKGYRETFAFVSDVRDRFYFYRRSMQ